MPKEGYLFGNMVKYASLERAIFWHKSLDYWHNRCSIPSLVYVLKFVGPLEFKLVAPMPEQLKTTTMHFYEASKKPYRKLGEIFPLFFVGGEVKTMNFGLIFPQENNIHFWKKNVDLASFAELSFWQLLICASWHLRKMHCCGTGSGTGATKVKFWILRS